MIRFHPPPTNGYPPFFGVDNFLNDAEFNKLMLYLSTREKNIIDGTVSSQALVNPSQRESQVNFFKINSENEWFCSIMAHAINRMNSLSYRFDLYAIMDPFQYTIYEGTRGGHYDWHTDMMEQSEFPQRKLSAVLQISDPIEYEGGELQINCAGNQLRPAVVPKKKNYLCIFPSFSPHRVTPVTKGTRKTIVAWSCGPEFR